MNNQLVIDHWGDQGGTEWASAGIVLTAGQKYDIKMEYFENGWGAMATLKWSGPGIAKTVIPEANLLLS